VEEAQELAIVGMELCDLITKVGSGVIDLAPHIIETCFPMGQTDAGVFGLFAEL